MKKDGQELEDSQIKDATSTLTKSQAAAVKKRIEKLNDTLRKKRVDGGGGVDISSVTSSSSSSSKRSSRVPDVRDIFPPNAPLTDGQVHVS